MLARLRSAVSAWLRRERIERDMADELAFHLSRRVDDLIASGVPEPEARRRARLEFGGLERVKEDCRDARRLHLLADVQADVIYAGRILRRAPGLAAVLIISLALGIGVNALVFSIVRGLVLRPLPVADPARVVFVEGTDGPGQSYPNYVDLRDRVTAFEGLAGSRAAPLSVEAGAGARRAWGYLATGNYFDVLGVKPIVGRVFHAEDDVQPGAATLAILSYDEWTSHYASDPSVVGTTIRINKVPYTVIGVTPRGFYGTEVFYRPAYWLPMMMEAQVEVGNPWLANRATFNLWTIGRLKRGVTIPQAEANLNAVAADLAQKYPYPNRGMVLHVATPGLVGSVLRRPLQAFSFGVLGLSALVLILACVNLASLLLARGTDRRREMAIRVSMGAGRGRLVRQLLTESLVLAAAGGISGIAAAAVLARALTAWQLPLNVPAQIDVTVDYGVMLYTFGVALSAALVFGVAPARLAARTDPMAVMKDGGHGDGTRRWALRDALIALQVTLSFVLVTACFVSLRGLQLAVTMPLGFDPDHVAIASFDLGLAGYDDARGAAFQHRIVEEAARLPGVSSASFSNSLPLSIDQSNSSVYPERTGAARDPQASWRAVVYSASPGLLRTLSIPLVTGRDFDSTDGGSSRRVVIVNETFVRQVLQTSNPIGMRFRFGPGGPLNEVIGVIKDGKYETLAERPRPVVFQNAAQRYNGTTVLSVRSDLPPEQVATEVRALMNRLDPSLPLYDVESLHQMLALALLPNRAAAVALGVFGALALVLAAVGLYSLVAYAVARRLREIAIRIAVGASVPAVLEAILGRTAILLGAGCAAGALLALLTMRVLSGIVYGVSADSPGIIGLVSLTMALLGVSACAVPARRALRTDPVSILKAE